MTQKSKILLGIKRVWRFSLWCLYILVIFKAYEKFLRGGGFKEGWEINALLFLIALILLVPRIYKRKVKESGSPSFASQILARLVIACILLISAELDPGGAMIDRRNAEIARQEAEIAYQKLSPEEKLEFDRVERKKKLDAILQQKINKALYAEPDSAETSRLSGISQSIAAEEAAKKPIEVKLPSYRECVSNGIKYYKSIGSYPLLQSTFENAEDVAKNNCSRSRVAFGS